MPCMVLALRRLALLSVFDFALLFCFAGSRIRVGLLALPLCGAAVTFFLLQRK
jgi:hypothetical protein